MTPSYSPLESVRPPQSLPPFAPPRPVRPPKAPVRSHRRRDSSCCFNNSMGLMVDPNRNLIWAVGQYSDVHVLRLDLRNAKIHELR